MGGAFTGVADDVNALTWNPAGVALLTHPEVGYLHMLYLADIGYNFGGIALPLPAGEDTWGLGGGIVNLGTSFDSTFGTAPSVSTGDNAFLLSVAFRVKNIISFGVTGKYIMRSIASYHAAAFGGDAGVMITPGDRFKIGLGIFNVGQEVQFISAADPLPMTGRLGLSFKVLDLPHHSLLLAVDNSYQFQAQAYQGSAGMEYWLDKTLALRGGYTMDNNQQQHWTAGAGVNLTFAQLDYAYAPISTLGDTHRISLILRFGAEEANGLLSPTGFSAQPMDSAMALSWKPSASKDVVGYNLYVKRPGATDFAKLTAHPINDTSAKLKHLLNGSRYAFAVAAVSAAGRESSMIQVAAIPMAAPAGLARPTAAPTMAPALQAPTAFKAEINGDGLLLTWDRALSPNVAGFNLYLADEKGKPGKKLNPQPIADNKLALKKVVTDKTYQFLLTAVGKDGLESALSDVLSANLTALRKAQFLPGHFTVEAGDGEAHLSWDAVNDVVGYHIYASDDGKAFKQLTKSGPKNILKVVLKPLKNGKTYYFAVTSVSTAGEESDKVIQSVVPGPTLK